MRPFRPLALLLLLALIAAPAMAQTPAPPAPLADPDAALVEELVVVGRLPGPAWWTVSDGDTTVHVLGVPSLAPKRMQWDRAIFENRLAGANAVILPFTNIRAKGVGALGAGLNLLRLRSGGPFEDRLDPATRARFVAVRERLGQPKKHYPTSNALAAGVQLAADYREAHELTTTDPAKLVELLARRANVPVVERTYDIGPLLGAIIRTSPETGRLCFDEVLAQAEAGPGVTLQAARAWATADVPGALENERTYERCLVAVPGGRQFDERMKADTVAAINAALAKPGHAIALVPLRPLPGRTRRPRPPARPGPEGDDPGRGGRD
ncbi:TraB/GumN family protein [Phenylobacterium sp. J367]|uniref:TraB/GumN family protein n=1 Tax=Phenylobacterium sp. J367 TaxID=2898435 RepID=UPI00215074E9|nr:TraB/GumN family protein [Phenylobacterium sp. J367]MCR5877856.1 TraB/GumN family protein [Phenylobacterium sp. J367]